MSKCTENMGHETYRIFVVDNRGKNYLAVDTSGNVVLVEDPAEKLSSNSYLWYKVVDEATGGGSSTTNQNFVLKNNSKPLVVKSSRRGDGQQLQRLDVVVGQGRDVLGERWTLEERDKGGCHINSGSYPNHIFTGVRGNTTVRLQEKHLADRPLSRWTFVPAEDADPRYTPDGGASLTPSGTAPPNVSQRPSCKGNTFKGDAGTSLGSAQSNQRKPVKGNIPIRNTSKQSGRDGGRRRNP